MSDDKRTAPPRTEIRIKQLWFSMPNGREIPIPGPHGGLTQMVSQITAGKNAMGGEFAIVYEPQLRRHRVAYNHVASGMSRTFCIPESWCVYEPVE